MKKSLATTSLLAGLILLIFLVYARTTDAQGSSESSQIEIGMGHRARAPGLDGQEQVARRAGQLHRQRAGRLQRPPHVAGHDGTPNFGSNYEEGGDPFLGQPEQIYAAGYLAGGRPFGPFTSRNLTPNGNGLPAGLTLDIFIDDPADWRGQQEPSSA